MKRTFALNIKRIVSLLIVFVMMSAMPLTIVSAEEINEALIVFDKKLELYNVRNVELASTTMATKMTLSDGTPVWSFEGKGNEPNIYINLPDTFESSNVDGSEYEVEINYYDNLSGYAIVYYDSAMWGPQVAYELYLTSTDTWKTAKFTLDDAAFNGNIDKKGDLKISFAEVKSSLAKTPYPVKLRSIKVTRKPNKNPIFAEAYTDRTGNIFEYYNTQKVVHNSFTNTEAVKKNVSVEYRLVNTETGGVVYRKSDNFDILPKKTVIRDVNIDTDMCGLHEWKVDILNDRGESVKCFDEDTIAIVKTDPNKIKSEFSWINAHLQRYRQDDANKLLEVLDMSNTAGLRIEATWATAEKTKGQYTFRGERIEPLFEQASRLGLKLGVLIGYNNRIYNKNDSYQEALPDTKEELDGFKKYCDFIAKTYGKYFDIYEVWNEPNIATFNHTTYNDPVKGGAQMKDVTYAMRESVNKYDPTAGIASVSITGLNLDASKQWLEEALKNGIADKDAGMNIMSLHTYHERLAPEEAKMYNVVKEYQKKVEEYGIKDIPVYISEYGVTTPDDNTGLENKTNWVIRDTILFKAHGVGDYMFLYNAEQKGIIDKGREDNFGIVTHPEQKYQIDGKTCVATRPYVAYTAMNYVLGGKVEEDGTWEPGNDIYLNRFKSEKWNSNVLTMWSANGEKSLTLDLGVNSVDYYDRYGNKTTVTGDDGIFTFVLDERPAYIVGNFTRNIVKNHEPLIKLSEYKATSSEADGGIVLKADLPKDKNYTVEAMLADGQKAEVSNEDGKTVVRCKTNKTQGETSSFLDLYVKDNDKNVAYMQLPILFTENFKADLSFKVKDSSDYNNWDVSAEVTNYMKESPITGYIEFAEPSEFAALGKIDIGKIEAATTKTVTFNVANLVQKGFRNFEYSIVTNEGGKITDNISRDLNIATRAKNSVKIDGIAEPGEWPTNTFMTADSAENAVNLSGFEWTGADDKSAKAAIMWDDEYMYLYSEVTDDVYFQDQDAAYSYKGDGIQFGLLVDTGEDAFTALGQANTVFNEFAISALPDTGEVATHRHKVQFDRCKTGSCKGAEGAMVRNGNKTYYEWRMPWSEIVGIENWKPQEGQKLGFSALWNDNDGQGRKGWVEYASGIGVTKNSKDFTNLEFIK